MPIPRVVDLSHWQIIGADGFKHAAKAGIWGIINKVTQSTGQVDPTYAGRRPLVKAAGMLYGGYHFMVPGNVKAQAEYFLRHAKPDDNTLLALDWEDFRGRAPSASEAHEFMAYIDEKVGRPTVVYSGNTAKEKLGSRVDAFFAKHRLWLAMYASRPVCQPSWSTPWLWQYSGDGHGPLPHSVPGLGTKLDMNDYVLDDRIGDRAREALKSEWGQPISGFDQKPTKPQNEIASKNVKEIQEHLNTLGADPILKVDGDAGERTHEAIKKFQALVGLKQDGIYGGATSAAMDLELAKRIQSKRGEETPNEP